MTDHLATAKQAAPSLKPTALGALPKSADIAITHALIAIAERLPPPAEDLDATAILPNLVTEVRATVILRELLELRHQGQSVSHDAAALELWQRARDLLDERSRNTTIK